MRTKSTYLFLVLLLAFSLTACGAPAPTAVDPAAIVQGFWDAIKAKNIDAAMAFVADDVQISGGPTNSMDKAALSAFLSSETKRGVTFEISDLKAISSDTVTFNQKVYDNGTQLANGPGKFQVNNDGEIVVTKFTD